MREPADIIAERAITHGDFAKNAEVSQKLKAFFRQCGYDDLPPVQRECLDMMALKLSRVLSGKANHAEHWDDLAGYATLGSAACGTPPGQ
jgi:hypothetical protein